MEFSGSTKKGKRLMEEKEKDDFNAHLLHANEQRDSCLTNTVTGGSSRSAGWWINIPGDANQSARHAVGGSEVGPGDWCNTKGRRKWRSVSFS